jgi:hypothetical protein
MVEVTDNFIFKAITSIFEFFDAVPEEFRVYLNLGIFIVLVTLYALFVWKFYRFLGKRDLLELNLSKYNTTANKFFAVLLFILEYIVILPIVVFFWFFVVALILLVLAKEHTINSILLISAVIVGAVRITSYYKEDLSRDLAKMFPFTILAVAILTPGFLDLQDTISKISAVPNLLSNILIYLVIIMVLEFILRIVFLIMPPIDDEDDEDSK